jgi:putative nucleotidyltransferase-like protein
VRAVDGMTAAAIAAASLPGVAAHGLAGSVLESPGGPFEAHEWFALLRACRDHGLVSLLAAAAHRGGVVLSAVQAQELAGAEREVAALALHAEQRALQASVVLDGVDVEHRVLGGSPRSRLGYRDPAARTFPSVALLVPPDALGLARELCRGVGRGRRVVVRSTLDLADVSLGLDRMADPGALLVLADRPVPTATVEEHLVLACLELVSLADAGPVDLGPEVGALDGGLLADGGEPFTADGDCRLVVERDVAELTLSPAVDPDRVRQVAQGWGVLDLTARAIAETWRTLSLADRTALSVWAEREVQHRPRRHARSGRHPRSRR